MAALFTRSVRKLQPRRAFVGLGLGLYALALPLLALAITTGVPQIAFGLIHIVLFGSMSLSYGFRALRGAAETPGELVVDADRITFGGKVLVHRSEVRQGFLVPDEQGTLVRLERKGRFQPGVHVRVRDEAEGRELLRVLGLDAGHAAAEMRIATGLLAMPLHRQLLLMLVPVFGLVAASVGIAAALAATGAPLIMLMVLSLFVWIFGLAFTPTKVRIGTDGIVTRWLGRERFISYSSVRKVQSYDEWVGTKQQRGVRVTLVTGEEIKLPTGQTTIGTTEAARLAERIAEAREAGRTGDAAATTLLRGGRSARAWLSALRGVGEGARDLRTPAIPHDVLLRVVEDAGATEAARVSAAIAALSSPSDEARTRVRVAAEVSASPKLRVALDRVAAGTSEDELAAILDAIEPAELAAKR